MADVRCPRCGSRTVILTAKADDRQYHVCVNRPRCKGRVLADEFLSSDWGDDWGTERPASKTIYEGSRQRRGTYIPAGRADTALRRSGGDKLEFGPGRSRPAHRGGLTFDDVWRDDWGHDWGEGKPARKPAPYAPQYPRAQKRATAPEVEEFLPPRKQAAPRPKAAPARKEPARARPQTAPGPEPYFPQYPRAQQRAAAPEIEEFPRPRPKAAPKKQGTPEKTKPSQPRPRAVSKPEAAPEIKEPPKPRQPIVPRVYAPDEAKVPAESKQPKASKHVSYLPLYKMKPKVYVAPDKEEHPEPQQQTAPQEETAFGTKGQPRPRWREILSKDISLKKEELPKSQRTKAPEAVHAEPVLPVVPSEPERVKPRQPMLPKEEVVPRRKTSPRPRPRMAPQGERSPEEKKRALIIMVIALIVAFLAIDGMLYAAFVLR